MSRYILALDQGTTSSRALVFDEAASVRGVGQYEFAQHFPASGWVEHEAEDLWSTTLAACRDALKAAGIEARDLAAIGVTNQRETVVVWDRATGEAIHRAIVWQDRRTADLCQALRATGEEADVAARTGLLLDPYFSATKAAWILDQVPGARARAERGELCFGTVDSWLIWKLTGGKTHATDATNASRTQLYNIRTGEWDERLLSLFRVPRAMLPQVRDCAGDFGVAEASHLGAAVAIRGVAGDQQAAMIGQACFQPGTMKATYGTGCFALVNTGPEPVVSNNRLLTTVAYQLAGQRTYALEGSIFVAGAAVQWLRDGLGVLESASQSGPLAALADPAQDVILVPAFVGLGAPYWNAEVRGALFGLTRNTGPRELMRAALESVCFQTNDLLTAIRADWTGAAQTVLRVDGGMAASDFTLQRLADLVNAPVDRPEVTETTALGAAYLAGLAAGVYPEPAVFADRWRLDRRFTPQMQDAERAHKLEAWRRAVRAALSTTEG
ncbi:MAG: glycerol kinase GlpK [Pseudomonadota bacterium]|jgi:glycerol kinase